MGVFLLGVLIGVGVTIMSIFSAGAYGKGYDDALKEMRKVGK